MRKISLLIIAGILIWMGVFLNKGSIPKTFVWLSEVDPSIQVSIRYATSDNFTGRPVKGYAKKGILLTKEAAAKLKEVQAFLQQNGYSLVVYDGYRPQFISNSFLAWAKDAGDQLAKKWYYPSLEKSELLSQGYLSDGSAHSRGSTVDISIIAIGQKPHAIQVQSKTLRNGETIPFLNDGSVDMGTSFDLFHEASHPASALIDDEARKMRDILRHAMMAHGFQPYLKQWWHYTLADEPYPNLYFNFDIN